MAAERPGDSEAGLDDFVSIPVSSPEDAESQKAASKKDAAPDQPAGKKKFKKSAERAEQRRKSAEQEAVTTALSSGERDTSGAPLIQDLGAPVENAEGEPASTPKKAKKGVKKSGNTGKAAKTSGKNDDTPAESALDAKVNAQDRTQMATGQERPATIAQETRTWLEEKSDLAEAAQLEEIKHKAAAKIAARRIWFALSSFYMLPDPGYFIRRLSWGYLDPASSYAVVAGPMMKFGALILTAFGVLFLLGHYVLEDRLKPALDVSEVATALTLILFAAAASVILGFYFYWIVAGYKRAIRIIVRELTYNDAIVKLTVEAYGGCERLLADTAARFDQNSQGVMCELLKDPEVLRVDTIVRCLNTNFFSYMAGDDSSYHVLLVTLILTSKCPGELNTNPKLRKALCNALKCSPAPLHEILRDFAYPRHHSDYGKVMLALATYLECMECFTITLDNTPDGPQLTSPLEVDKVFVGSRFGCKPRQSGAHANAAASVDVLRVAGIEKDCVMDKWNIKNPAVLVRRGDHIVSVGDATGAQAMKNLLKQKCVHSVKIKRHDLALGRARMLNATISGWGTDEKNLSRFLLCCSFEERRAAVQSFNGMVKDELFSFRSSMGWKTTMLAKLKDQGIEDPSAEVTVLDVNGKDAGLQFKNDETKGVVVVGNVSSTAFPLRVVKRPSQADSSDSLGEKVDDKQSGVIAGMVSGIFRTVMGGAAAEHPFHDAVEALINCCDHEFFVTVKSATNLPNKEWFGGVSDPYVDVQVGDTLRRTKTIENSLDPEWDPPATLGPFIVRSIDGDFGEALVTLRHEGLKDTPLAQIRVDLNRLPERDDEGWSSLTLSSNIVKEADLPKGRSLFIQVVSASKLKASDGGWLGGLCDPWVSIKLDSEVRETKTIKDGGAAVEWNEQVPEIELDGPRKQIQLHVDVLDDDSHVRGRSEKNSDLLGTCNIIVNVGDSGANIWTEHKEQLRDESGSQLPAEIVLKTQVMDAKDLRKKMKALAVQQASTKSESAKMKIALQANLYEAGSAPVETDPGILKTAIDIAMKPPAQKSKIVQLLCRASDQVVQTLRVNYSDWFKEAVRTATQVNAVNRVLGAVDAVIGTELTGTDDVVQLVGILQLDNVTSDDKPYSDRYLTELRTCIQEMDEIGMIGLLLPLKSPYIDPRDLCKQYKQKFNRTLLADLMEATSQSEMLESLMCGLIAGDDLWLWARTLYESMKGGWTGLGTDESTLTDVLVLNRHNLKGLQASYESVARAKSTPETLRHAIESETSGKFQWFLLAMLS